MKGKMWVLCAVGILACLFPAIASYSSAAEQKEIRVGAILDLTGMLSPIGVDSQKGIMLAFEKAGYKIAGKTVKLIVEDGASDPNTTMDKTRKLVETNKVQLIIGPIHSGACAVMAPYLDRVKVPQIGISCNNDELALKHKWMFLTAGLLHQFTYPAGVYACNKMGYKTATTLATDYVAGHDFTAGFVDGFQDKGGKVIQQQWFPEKTTDFTPYVVSLKKSDCFVPWLAGNFAFSGLRQFKELGVKMPIIEPEDGGVTVSPPAIKELGNLVKDITTAAIYAYTLDTPGNKEFVQAYKDKYNVLPGPMSGGGYSSAQVAMAALEKTRGQGKPEDLLEAITNVSIMTVRGPISYTKEHVGISTTWIFKIDENLVPQLVGQGRTRADKVGDKMVVKLIE